MRRRLGFLLLTELSPLTPIRLDDLQEVAAMSSVGNLKGEQQVPAVPVRELMSELLPKGLRLKLDCLLRQARLEALDL